ncbi:MAG: hypothetical protein ACOC4B_01655 [Bacteroidota bacterium]
MQKISITDAVKFLGEAKSDLFFSLRGYVNSAGEVANHTIKLNIDRTVLKERALTTLQGLSFEDTKEAARLALIQSIVKPSENRSKGQINAFVRVNQNVQFCPETKQISIFGGQRIAKKVLVEGTYKTVNSRPLTIAKNKLVSEYGLDYFKPARYNIDASKFEIYKNGNTLEFIAK